MQTVSAGPERVWTNPQQVRNSVLKALARVVATDIPSTAERSQASVLPVNSITR